MQDTSPFSFPKQSSGLWTVTTPLPHTDLAFRHDWLPPARPLLVGKYTGTLHELPTATLCTGLQRPLIGPAISVLGLTHADSRHLYCAVRQCEGIATAPADCIVRRVFAGRAT